MATKYKLWIEIERIENEGENNETYVNEDSSISVGLCDTLEEAIDRQNLIVDMFT